jgi:hypothetical protein
MPLSGCPKKAPPDYLKSLAAEPPEDYPRSHFMCSLGTHKNSEAEALANARTEVSLTIKSRIESEIVQLLKSVDRDGDIKVVDEFTSRTLQRSDFSKNELIRIVSSAEWEGRQNVYACMNRREAGKALLNGIRKPLSAYLETAKLAVAAVEKNDLGLFTTQWRAAQEHESVLMETAAQLRAIHKASYQEVQSALENATFLQQTAQRIRAGLTLGINANQVAKKHQGTVESTFSASLQELGVKVVGDGATCSKDPAAPSHVLYVGAEPDCKDGSVGRSCSLSFPVRLEACGSGGAHQGLLKPKEVSSFLTSFDPERALSLLWKSITASACDDKKDNDRDGLKDYRKDGSGDPGCTGPGDKSETEATEKQTLLLEAFLSTEFPLERLAAAR